MIMRMAAGADRGQAADQASLSAAIFELLEIAATLDRHLFTSRIEEERWQFSNDDAIVLGAELLDTPSWDDLWLRALSLELPDSPRLESLGLLWRAAPGERTASCWSTLLDLALSDPEWPSDVPTLVNTAVRHLSSHPEARGAFLDDDFIQAAAEHSPQASELFFLLASRERNDEVRNELLRRALELQWSSSPASMHRSTKLAWQYCPAEMKDIVTNIASAQRPDFAALAEMLVGYSWHLDEDFPRELLALAGRAPSGRLSTDMMVNVIAGIDSLDVEMWLELFSTSSAFRREVLAANLAYIAQEKNYVSEEVLESWVVAFDRASETFG